MTVNAIGFYAAALLVVASGLACMVLPSPRHALAAGLAFLVAVALMLGVSGASLLALAQLLLPAAFGAFIWWRVRSYTSGLIDNRVAGFIRVWPVGLGIALACGVLLVGLLLSHSGDWAQRGHGGGSLLTVLHYREPIEALLAAGLLALALVGSILTAAVSEDERLHTANIEARRRKQERIARQRADREAARRKRAGGGR